MRLSTRNLQHTVAVGKHKRPSRKRRPAVEALEERALLSAAHDHAAHKHVAVPDNNPASDFVVTGLVINIRKQQLHELSDKSLVNPWDINFQQDKHNDPFVWVSDQGAGVATMYNIKMDGKTAVKSRVTVKIPTFGSSTPSGPTGVVYNSTYNTTTTNEFMIPGPHGKSVTAEYIFDTLQGTIGGYNPGPNGKNSKAQLVVTTNNPSTTEYTGLAAGTLVSGGPTYIYAANADADASNDHTPGIDVYNSSFQLVTFPQQNPKLLNFYEPNLPAGFTPFNVRDLGSGGSDSTLYVTYRGPGGIGGAVARFSNSGYFEGQIDLDSGKSGNLQSPYGLDQAPSGFGKFSNDILVGNFGSGLIDAYNADGTFKGQLNIENDFGKPVFFPIQGLMALHFGKGLGAGKPKIALLFTASLINGVLGLYGTITPAT
jgi:uncharacterized protein (TIGR03118 family)